jgi:hypothetical protein
VDGAAVVHCVRIHEPVMIGGPHTFNVGTREATTTRRKPLRLCELQEKVQKMLAKVPRTGAGGGTRANDTSGGHPGACASSCSIRQLQYDRVT